MFRLCALRLVPAPVPPLDPKAQKCSKEDAVLAHGGGHTVMLPTDYSASGRVGGELEAEWRGKHNTPSSHSGPWHPTPHKATCPEVGVCSATPHGAAARHAASAAVGWLYGIRDTYVAGAEFWAVEYQQSAHAAWMLWSAAPVLCVAHTLWSPRRCVVVRCQWSAAGGSSRGTDEEAERTKARRPLAVRLGRLDGTLDLWLLPSHLHALFVARDPCARASVLRPGVGRFGRQRCSGPLVQLPMCACCSLCIQTCV